MGNSRQTWYSGEQVQSTVVMQQMRDDLKSAGRWMEGAFGDQLGRFFGLAATPGSGLTVNIGTGSLYQYLTVDSTAWSTLAADSAQTYLQGLVTTTQNLTGFNAPATTGQSINYLIEAQLQVTDSANVNLPFYNSANPSSPILTSKSPTRVNVVAFQVKAGTAATTGSQTTPAPDTGWLPLYAVTVDHGESSLTSADIVLAANSQPWYGFVEINPSGNSPVFLSPVSQQTGFINISGNATFGVSGTNSQITVGNASAVTGSTKTTIIGPQGAGVILGTSVVSGTLLNISDSGRGALFALDTLGDLQIGGNFYYNGFINYTGTHAGTDADPYPASEINATMLGGKVAADYALASGNYITVYAGTPTLATGNAGISGTFQANALQSNVASGTAPITVASTTLCPNLNASLLAGFAATNTSGNIPISNGILNVNLNAQLLNGMPSSAFQPAGNYAAMNIVNNGSFTAQTSVSVTGGLGSSQINLTYQSSNFWGINSGGSIGLIQVPATRLALVAFGEVHTANPLKVGGDAHNQPVYAQDCYLNGMLRGGMVGYNVTFGFNGNSHPFPGNGQGAGAVATPFGSLNLCNDTIHNSQFWIGYRTKVTFTSSTLIDFFVTGLPVLTVWVDGVNIGSTGFGVGVYTSYTFSAGTHTIDLVYQAYNMNQAYYLGTEGVGNSWGGNLTLFGWVPQVNGAVSTNITSAIPG